ncbi:MAG: 50S ribosomal protein L30 [Spirochaetales bacterium]|jgi:large subunit ribosomal protein L30|nr:50S ribosomal protein L30 [Spirochaetales bacterium]
MAKLKVELVRSLIGQKPMHRKTVKALGLGKINSVAEHSDSPMILGMLRQVSHLVKVEELQ